MLTKFIQPSIEVLNLRIDEPVTTLTDVLLAVICFYAFIRIGRLESAVRGRKYFRLYFLVLGTGALTGGLLGHAFQYRLTDEWKLISWILTPVSVSLIIQALLEVARPWLTGKTAAWISRINILILFPVLGLTIRYVSFLPVKYYAAFGLIVMAGSLNYFIFQKSRERGVLFLVGGIGIGFLSMVIFSLEWGFSAWFNHRDISHMILCLSVFYMYKGIRMILVSNAAG